ncbi:unnamed protein product [Owenia fusiformis]|uniref:Uncharacterized protein n=1 Tax=Owenia fusiformis TaxID=6347 RepID=A0A8J1Y5Z7_OWEFU|nr:unnamed protein product [Owenia fusiformis]
MLPAILFILSLIFVWIVKKILWKGLDIPGPKGTPIFGNAFQLDQNAPFVQFLLWSRQYGSVFKIQLFNEEVVVLNDYDVIKEALLEKSGDFAGRPSSWRMKFITPGGHEDIIWRDLGPDLKKLKKIAHSGLKQFGDGMDRITSLASDEIQDCITRFRSNNGVPFDPRELVGQCIINIMIGLVLGENVNKDSVDFKLMCYMLDTMDRCGAAGMGKELDMFPWLRFFGNSSYKILKEYNEIRERLLSSWIQRSEYKLSMHTEEARSVTETLLQHYKLGNITRNEMHGVLIDILLGGIVTTESTLKAFLLILINKPEVQKNIQREIDDCIGDDRLPTFKDRHNMPYTEAAILEILRYSTTSTLSIPHKALCDTSVGGYKIPRGTVLWMNIWGMHHDEKYFDDPYEFKVERFLDKNGNLILAHDRKSFLPFGVGKRECLGEAMAKVRMFLFVTGLLQKLEIVPEDINNPPDPDPAKFVCAITNQPGPFNIVVKDRRN